jgi:hypothetical protein
MTTVTFKLGGTLVFDSDEPAARPGSIVTLRYDGFTVSAKGEAMAYNLPNDKFVEVRVAYVDAKGNPATVDGPVTWDTSDPNIASVAVDQGDTQQARVTPTNALGNVQITATADADLGAGVTSIITLMDVTIIAGQAVAGTISPVGEPQPIP